MILQWKFYYQWCAAWIGIALFACLATGKAVHAQMPNPASVVKATAYASLDPVPQGQTFEAAVVMQIIPGFHMNSHKPSEDYLIPTTITPAAPAGIRVVDTVYPAGQLKNFSFSPNKPLDVYTDSVTLQLKLSADAKAPIGPMSIPVTLRYQACNDKACLPPVKVPVTIDVKIAAAGAKAQHVHPEIFTAKH